MTDSSSCGDLKVANRSPRVSDAFPRVYQRRLFVQFMRRRNARGGYCGRSRTRSTDGTSSSGSGGERSEAISNSQSKFHAKCSAEMSTAGRWGWLQAPSPSGGGRVQCVGAWWRAKASDDGRCGRMAQRRTDRVCRSSRQTSVMELAKTGAVASQMVTEGGALQKRE